MNIDIDLMLTITAGIILSQIISYSFSCFFSYFFRLGTKSESAGSVAKCAGFNLKPTNGSLSFESLDNAFKEINQSESD